MDQQKIGVFLKELRKQKEITQEQLADKFNVSSRTVSRWENGNNMPDLDILIEVADFYEVDLREILNGERKTATSFTETDSILQAVEYTKEEYSIVNKRILIFDVIAVILLLGCILLRDTDLYNDYSVVRILSSVSEGLGVGMIIAGIIMTSSYGAKIRNFKKRILKRRN